MSEYAKLTRREKGFVEAIKKMESEIKTDNYTIADLNHQIDGFKTRISELEQQLAQERWIPASERLPKISEDIILIRDNVGNFMTAVFDGDYILESGRVLPFDDMDEITHWREINPPSEVRDGHM